MKSGVERYAASDDNKIRLFLDRGGTGMYTVYTFDGGKMYTIASEMASRSGAIAIFDSELKYLTSIHATIIEREPGRIVSRQPAKKRRA